jgi:hypothetical protein
MPRGRRIFQKILHPANPSRRICGGQGRRRLGSLRDSEDILPVQILREEFAADRAAG